MQAKEEALASLLKSIQPVATTCGFKATRELPKEPS
jgi:hypothetical protein